MPSLVPLVSSLLSELPEESTPSVIVVKPERPTSTPSLSRVPSGKLDHSGPSYKPGVVYTLELATILTLRDEGTIEALGEDLAASLQSILRDASSVHPLVTSRVVYYVMNLLRLSYVSSHIYTST